MKRYAFGAAMAASLMLVATLFVIGTIPADVSAIGMILANAPVIPAAFSEEINKLGKDLTGISDNVKNFAEDVKKKFETGQTVTAELKEKADKALTEQATLREQIEKLGGLPGQFEELHSRTKELEQTLARRKTGVDKPDDQKTPGEIFVDHERVKAAMAQGAKFKGRVVIDVKSITTAAHSHVIVPDRVPGILSLPERRLTVRDLLTPGRTNSNAIQYIRQTGFTNNAQIQTEAQTKGESDIATEQVTANVATIAHFMIGTKQVLEDAPMLQSLIDGQLRYGLAYAEEVQLLSGDGDNGNIEGLIPTATAFAAAFTPNGYQRIDAIRLALLQAELALFPSTGVVVNPTDWAHVELTKDGENRYIFVQPQNETQPRLWGRPIVSTPAMSVGNFLAGAFKLGAQIFDREDANVELSTEDSDNFRKNLVTIRAEERLALAKYRTEAFIYGALPNVT